MKKFTIIAVALCVGFMLAVPAMALEVQNDGSMRVRGYSDKGYTFDETAQSTDSFYDQRLRINTKFIVSDNLMVRTRVDILDAAVAGDAAGDPVDEAQVDWERAWMVVKTPAGAFQAGWMAGGEWGTSFKDSGTDQFRVRFDTKLGPVKTGLILRKAFEGDRGPTISSGDANVYYTYVVYPSENITAGLLYGYIDFKQGSDGAPGTEWKAVRHALLPFFKAKFGPVGIQGEVVSVTGDSQDFFAAGATDTDISELAYNLEGSFNFGAGSAQLGYAFASGQDTTDPDDEGTNLGDDWEKLYILAGSTGPTPGGIGGRGNFTPTGGNDDGIALIYGGANFNVTDAINLGVMLGQGTADEPAVGQDDALGVEVDLTLKWKFYDGALTYTAVAAYLSAGDYWEAGIAPADYDDSCYALFHRIQIAF